MIIGSIVAILILVWYYHTASNAGKNPVHWAIVGFIIYFIISLLWTYFINPSIKDAAMHSRDGILMLISRYAYIVVALVGAIVFNLRAGKKKID